MLSCPSPRELLHRRLPPGLSTPPVGRVSPVLIGGHRRRPSNARRWSHATASSRPRFLPDSPARHRIRRLAARRHPRLYHDERPVSFRDRFGWLRGSDNCVVRHARRAVHGHLRPANGRSWKSPVGGQWSRPLQGRVQPGLLRHGFGWGRGSDTRVGRPSELSES